MDIQKVVFMLMAQDMDRAVAFYTDVMGLKVNYQSPDRTELAYGDAGVALHGGSDGEFRATGLGFTVADVEAAQRGPLPDDTYEEAKRRLDEVGVKPAQLTS